ncbi:MAG: hypothetical protein Fur0022_40890 [Anaerolineales bacterium]
MDVEQNLSDQLERLEAGENLDAILKGLPDEEGTSIRLAAQIMALPKPTRNVSIVRSQHQKVMQAAQAMRQTKSSLFPLSARWLIPIGGLFILFAAVAGLLVGITWGTGEKRPVPVGIARDNTPTVVADTSPIFEGESVTGFLPTPVITTTNPQTAFLFSVHGIVQVQTKDGTWNTIQTAEIHAGQTFRTWNLSSAELVFFDGTTVELSQNTLVTIESLDFQPSGSRRISLFQPLGETHHRVVDSNTPSTYVVRTPNAQGEAKGTTFQVAVKDTENSSFAVVEGEVTVTGQQTTVNIVPGQITLVQADTGPSEPVVWIQDEGVVSQVGSTWLIDGVEFQLYEGTQILGNPQPGDMVAVQGRELGNGTRFADRLEKLMPALDNQFRLIGLVEAMGVTQWTISGQNIFVNEKTRIDSGVVVGNVVLARGFIQASGNMLVTDIQLLDKHTRFEFSGLVERGTENAWSISGISIFTDENTEIFGEPLPGDIVHVWGEVIEDGTWLAYSIEKVSLPGRFEFVGLVQMLDPWSIRGVSIRVNHLTQIDPSVDVGVMARVEGRILEDGTWLANEIQSLNGDQTTLTFIGSVENISPWVVNGLPLNLTEETVVVGDISLHSLVRVYAHPAEDGSWLVSRIEWLETAPTSTCIEISDVIVSLNELEITLQSGYVIPRTVAEISGTLATGYTVFAQLCFGLEETINFASITVVPQVEPTPQPEGEEGETVIICHIPSGNANNAQTLTVTTSSVDAHLAHGDYLGACQDNDSNGPPNDKDDKNPKDDKNDKNDDKGNGNNK